MYLHLGGSTVVLQSDIIGIFDMDNTTVSPHTRKFLNRVQKEGENTCLTFSGGEVLTLSPKGEPLSFVREDLHLRVTWWQSGYLSTVS